MIAGILILGGFGGTMAAAGAFFLGFSLAGALLAYVIAGCVATLFAGLAGAVQQQL